MGTEVRYFRSQNYTAEEEISKDRALGGGTYVRVAFVHNQPERAEIFSRGQLEELVYYGHEPQDADFARAHYEEFGSIPITIYGLPARTAEGELQTLSGWNPSGELFHITKRLVDDQGEPIREEVRDASGALLGVRRFEYNGCELTRIVFTRADGAEIIELKDWFLE